MPSTKLLGKICEAYELDEGEALRVLRKDQERDDGVATEFAAYLDAHVFNPQAVPA